MSANNKQQTNKTTKPQQQQKQSKQQKQKKKKNATIPNLMSFQRINFLYQASHLMMDLKLQQNEQQEEKVNVNALDLSNHYSSTMWKIARKNVLRLHPDLKRTVCKKCNVLLIPGETSRVRTQGKRDQPHLVITCLQCGHFKRYQLVDDTKMSVDKIPARETSEATPTELPLQ